MIQRAKGSVWESTENIVVETVKQLKDLPPARWEGVVTVGGFRNVLDTGGGDFFWLHKGDRASADGKIAIDPTGTGVGKGIWIRIVPSNLVSLTWWGSNNLSTNNLLEEYGYENAVVIINEAEKGGIFTFKPNEVANHDGVNNFNGWVRVNDPNFTQDIKMNGRKITGGSYAVGPSDYPTLAQVRELAITGDYIGVVPKYSPRYTGDGSTVIYSTEAATAVPEPDPLLVSGAAFEVTVDGLKLRHAVDFNVEDTPGDPNFGKLTFVTPPTNGAEIDIVWFAPIMVELLNGTVVTATGSSTSNTLEDWVGNKGQDILVKATGTTGQKTLGDRFGEGAVYFDHEAGMIAGSAFYKVGSIVATKGRTAAGDGFLANYFIKTEAQAIIDGDDYTSLGTPNVFIPSKNWVAVFQRPGERIAEEEVHSLTNGQTVVSFTNNVSLAYFYVNGDDIDSSRLLNNIDYTVDPNGTTVTLTESYPAGTVLTANWFTTARNEDLIIDCGFY